MDCARRHNICSDKLDHVCGSKTLLSRFIFRLEFKLLATDKRRENEEHRKQIYEIREGIKEDFLTIFSRSSSFSMLIKHLSFPIFRLEC